MSLLRRFAPILLGLVGLIFAVTGAVMLASQTWEKTVGTVQACEAHTVQSGSSITSRRTEYDCEVTWETAGQAHTDSIGVGPHSLGPGSPVDLRVSGDSAMLDSAPWMGVVTVAGGTGLMVLGLVLFIRARRAG